MPSAPYKGPETSTSLRVLEALLPGLPAPAMLLGGWGVYFTVINAWKATTGQDYFGSRDIDLGFHTPPDVDAATLKAGNLPATLRYLLANGFHKHGAYQVVRYHAWNDDRALTEQEAARMNSFDVYGIVVDLVASHQRDDLASIAGFQAFSEPLLSHAFTDPRHRVQHTIGGAPCYIPAPHVLVSTKLRSLPQRTKDDKAEKDLCDLYAIIAYSQVPVRALRQAVHQLLPEVRLLVEKATENPHLEAAAAYLEIEPNLLRQALEQLA